MRGKRAETVDQLEAVRRAVPVIALGLAIVALILAAITTLGMDCHIDVLKDNGEVMHIV